MYKKERIGDGKVREEEVRRKSKKLSKETGGKECRQNANGEMLLKARVKVKIKMEGVTGTGGRYASKG